MAIVSMSTKKKMTTSLITLILICLVAVVGVIAVFSSTKVFVNHGIGITYFAKDFAGSISLDYKQANWADLHSTATFNGEEEENATESLGQQNLSLSRANRSIIFEYVISNSSKSVPFNVVFTHNPIREENTKPLKTLTSAASLHDSISATTAGWQEYNNASKPVVTLPVKTINEVPQYFYVIVELDEIENNVIFNATFAFNFEAQVD